MVGTRLLDHMRLFPARCAQINAHSSRSHCLLIINVVGTNAANGVRTVGKLTLCDLAGSERINKTGATGALEKMVVVGCAYDP